MKAVQRLAGQAAQAVEDETNEQLKRMQESAAAKQMQQSYWATTTTANTTTAANTNTTWLNYPTPLRTAPTLGGAPSWGPSAVGSTFTYTVPKPTIEFTPEQMTSFLAKLADMLTRGWECTRCHRIWAPQITGCEFCNFIDRLEGKDVERDAEA